MSNRSSRIGTKPVNRSRNQSWNRNRRSGKQTPWVWIGLVALVIVAGVIAVIASRGSGGSKSNVTAAGVQETRPVEVSGTPLPPMPASGTDPAIGMTIPELTGNTFDGTLIKIGPDGRAKLVVFVAHWCPHCQREVPIVVDYVRAHPLPANVDLVAVATSTSQNRPNYPPSAWLERVGWPGKVMADSANGDAATAFALKSFPYFVAVDASGKVVDRGVGELTTDGIAQLIAKAAATAG